MTRRTLDSWIRRIPMLAAALVCCAAGAAAAQEDTTGNTPTFREGDSLSYENLDQLRPFLPPEFWSNRDFFFYEGMRLEVGPFQRDYSPAAEYTAATEKFRGQPKLGPEASLENYTAGQPFPMEDIDCAGDPQAGAKIIWNFDYRWRGDGSLASFYYSYWDRGEELPLFYEGSSKRVNLTARVEPEYLDGNNGEMFRGEKRKEAFGVEVEAPFDARGIMLLSYRYKTSDLPMAQSKFDDTWVYVPTLRRVRRISTAQRTDAVSGTDFTLDDLNSFAGIVPQYEWECLGEMKLMAPFNTQVKGYPYEKDHNFGPYGLSYADDKWEMRDAVKLRMRPRNADHPYHHKDIYLDKETLEPLYSFAYDQKEELWKIIWHNSRWSEESKDYYPGWKGVETPRDMVTVSDTIANVQTGTGNRIEAWDNTGTPLASKGRVRRYIDLGRLTRGR